MSAEDWNRGQNEIIAIIRETNPTRTLVVGGMEIPMNPPRGRQQNKRLRDKGGVKAADFPEALIVDDALREELK